MTIARPRHLAAVAARLKTGPVVGLLGPRQVGKTTLARQVAAARRGPIHWFDLEDERDLDRLAAPVDALEALKGLVVIDEVQRRPDLFQALRVLADRRPLPARFLVLGSASPALLRQTSESLAGRIAYYELPGLSLEEAGVAALRRLWVRGGFPRAFLAKNERESRDWRRDLVRTYLERDLPAIDLPLAPHSLRRFWAMLAHVHGGIWNSSEFARSFGVSDKTVRRYLDILADTFMVRVLQPWHENLSKRQVKSPKVYFRDSGLLHQLAGIEDLGGLEAHPRCGASWEGFALEQAVQALGAPAEQCYFWATHQGAELDLLVVRGRTRTGFEFKFSRRPGLTPSMRSALSDLKLDRLWVVHSGLERFPLGKRVEAIPLTDLASVAW